MSETITIQKSAEPTVLFEEAEIRPAEIIVEAGAVLDLIALQQHAQPTREPVIKKIIVREGAIVRLFSGLFDSIDLHVTAELVGDHAAFEHHVLYFGHQKQDIKMTLVAHHIAKKTMSRTLVRGVVIDSAHADFAGNIVIAHTGSGTDAHLGHEGLLLSRRGRIDSLPGLEIETDDVKATHSSAVHYIRPDQLFYLQTRGIDERASKQMILHGFLEQALAIVHAEKPLQQIRDMITQKEHYI